MVQSDMLINLGGILVFIKRIISQAFCFLLVTVFFSGVAFADNITIKLDTIGGNRRQLSLWQIDRPAKKDKRIYSEQFDKDSNSDLFKINGKEIRDPCLVEVISKLVDQLVLVSKKLDLMLFYPDECFDEVIVLFDDSDDIGKLSDEKDFLFKNLIELLVRTCLKSSE